MTRRNIYLALTQPVLMVGVPSYILISLALFIVFSVLVAPGILFKFLCIAIAFAVFLLLRIFYSKDYLWFYHSIFFLGIPERKFYDEKEAYVPPANNHHNF